MNVIAEMDIKEKRSLLRALKDFILRIKNYLKMYGLTETKAFTDDFEAINKLANMVNESIAQEKNKANVEKHSFAGHNSLTANQSLYQEALKLEKDGVDTESIRQQICWFKSYDGKWRYEINDKDAVWLLKATDKLNKAKTYLKLENRYKVLEDKIDNNTKPKWHCLCSAIIYLKAGALTSAFEKLLFGDGSDILKYILAALVVPKSLLEPEFCTLLKASRNMAL